METIIMQEKINIFLSKFSIHTLQIIIRIGVFLIILLSGFVIGYWFGQYALIETLKDYYCTKIPIYMNNWSLP